MLSEYSATTVPYLRLPRPNTCPSRATVHGVAPKNIRINRTDSEGRLLLNSREIWMYAVQPAWNNRFYVT